MLQTQESAAEQPFPIAHHNRLFTFLLTPKQFSFFMKPTLHACPKRQMTTRLALITLVFLGLSQTRGFAQIYKYTTDSTGMYASKNLNVTATPLQLGFGVKHDNAPPCGPTDGLGTDGWPTTNVFNVNTFNTNGDFITFTITPNGGFGLKITGFSAHSRRENLTGIADDGPIAIRYGYSIDGGASWITVNPGNPQSSNLCASGGVLRVWPSWATLNVSGPVTFRIYGLSSGSSLKGDLFLRNVIVNGEVCSNAPTLVLGTFPAACFNTLASSTVLPYVSSTGTEYIIDYDAAANGAGFVDDLSYDPLPTLPNNIPIAIPAGPTPGIYNGTITVRNGCGFLSSPQSFTLTVNPLPAATVSVAPSGICAGESIEITFNESAHSPGTEFTVKADVKDNGGTNPLVLNDVINNDHLDWTEGSDFNGTLTVGTVTVTNETTGCSSTTPGFVLTVHPLPLVNCPANFQLCLNSGTVFLETLPGLSPPSVNASSSFSGPGVSPFLPSAGRWNFSPSSAGVGKHTITYAYTDGNGCSNNCTFDITVNAVPTASASNNTICSGENTALTVTNPNSVPGSTFNWNATYGGITGGAGSGTGVAFGVDAINETLVNPTNAAIVVTYTITPVGPAPTYCQGNSTDVFVTVEPAPQFAFSAASNNDGPYSGNNTSGASTLDVDFCVGNLLTLANYTDNGNVGFTASYTSSGNVTYDGGAVPAVSGPSNVTPANAATFFGTVYGGALGYGLSSGTSGTINQTFVPYLDLDDSGTLSPGDCEGVPMFLNYHIHAIPSVEEIFDVAVCKGAPVNVVISGPVPNTTYNWTNSNTAIGLAASGSGDIVILATTNTGTTDLVATITVTPVSYGCTGATESFTITVHPMPTFGFTATVPGRPAQTGSNANGPATVTVNFCAGESFNYTGFSSSSANVGFIEEITGGTTNTLYGVTPILVPRPKTYISPGAAPGFFAGTYGPYGLASGSFGTITEVFTPYYDVDNNGVYDEEIDCTGDPITLVYNIYALPTVIATPTAQTICSGDYTSIALSSDVPSTTFSWVATVTGGIVLGQSDGNGNAIAQPLTGTGTVRYRVTPTGPAPNFCPGNFFDVFVTVNPPVSPSIVADDYLICDGQSVTFTFNEGNYLSGTEFTITALITDDNVSNALVTLTDVTDGDQLVWTEGIDFSGNLTVTNIQVTVEGTPACVGEVPDTSILVNPPFTPVIYGPTCVHVGSEMQLTADNDISAPGTFVSGVWSSTENVTLLDTFDLDTVLVTGYVTGTATVYYTVTDNAGCVSTASYVVQVLDSVTVEHVYTGGPVTCGDEFTISVEVGNFCDISGLDYPFSWDENAFQLVSFMEFQPAPGGTFDAFPNPLNPGELFLSFSDNGNVPFGNDLPDGTVVLTYTLRAIGPSSPPSYNIPEVAPVAEASNSNFLPVSVNTVGVSVPIESISLNLVSNPILVCPSDDFVHIYFNNAQGNPNYYVIDFDGCPGFPGVLEGELVVADGEIIIPLLDGLQHGSCSATLVISNDFGCVSKPISFTIIIDETLPTAGLLHPTLSQTCLPAPAPNAEGEVINAQDNCPGPLMKMWVSDVDNGGSGCGSHPKIITRTYKVVDQAGNTSTLNLVQTITILDNVAPTVSTTGLASWYPSGAAAIAAVLARANATKKDNCTPPVGIAVSVGAVDTAGCTSTIQLIVTDACGNLTPFPNALYTVTIDRQKPTVTAGVIDDCYDEDDTPTAPYFDNDYAVQAAIAATTATDDCDASLTITVAISGKDCDLAIVVTATDDCGKSNSVTYHTRVENDAPIIFPYNKLALDGNCFTTEEDALAAAIAATTAGDDCTSPEDLQYDAFANGGCPAEIMVVVTDFCGNPSTITYTGVYIDTEDPGVDLQELVTACFTSQANALAALAAAANPTDNCSTTAELIASAQAIFNGNLCDQLVTVTFTDHCGRTVSTSFSNITIDSKNPTVAPMAPLTYVCLNDIDEPNTNQVNANDNCGVEDIVWLSDVLPASCPGTGTRTYRVTDCAGNSIDVVQSIIINDNVPPTWVTTPSNDLDRSFLCKEDYSAALALEPVAEDNCGEVSLAKKLGAFVPSVDCPQSGTYTNTWTAYDDCGNASTTVFTQVISIIDNQYPAVNFNCQFNPLTILTSAPADCPDQALISLEVGDIVHPNNTWTVAGVLIPSLSGCVIDNCASDEFINIRVVSIVYDDSNLGCSRGITITFEISDACGNINPTPFVCKYIITDNIAPVWVTSEGQPFIGLDGNGNPIGGIDITIACDDVQGYTFANSLGPVFADNCSDVDTVKITGAFTPGSCLGEGNFTNTWTAQDECGNKSKVFTQVITVVDNVPPTFLPSCQFMPLILATSGGYACPASATLTGLVIGQEINEGTIWNVAGFDVPPLAGCISDNCSPSSSIIVTVMSIVNQYDPENCKRTITLSFQLRDACANVQPTLFVCIYNIVDDTKPLVTAGSIGTCYATEEAALAAAIAATSATDNCTLAPVKIAVRTGTLCAATITVTAKDCAGNVSLPVSYSTRIDNTAPTMVVHPIPTCYLTQAAAQAAALAATTIADDCNTYGELTISVTTVGTCPATVTVKATDGCGNSRSVTYPGLCIGTGSSVMITTPASNGSTTCEMETSALAAWLANHGGAVASGSGIVWTYSPNPIVFSAPSCTTHTKSVIVTFKATDGCGYMATTTATFSVSDNASPTANLIANTNLTCTNGIPAPDVNLVTGEADNCDATPTVALFGTSDNGASGCPGSPRIVIHTYSVTDDYCNTTYISHMITVVDNIAPNFTAPANITITVNAGCVYNASPAATGDVTNESDNCTPSGQGLQAFYTDVVNPGVNNPDKYIITRTWKLTDACGNSAIPRVQTIKVQDVSNPTLTGCPSNSTLPGSLIGEECGSYAAPLTLPTFGDNCPNAAISYTLTGATTGSGNGYVPGTLVFLEGVTTVTYKVTDAVGNTVTCSFTVTVNCLTIAGRIIWEHDDVSGVRNATVKLSQGVNQLGTDLSDANGNYDLSVPTAGTYRITPVKNINRLNGVTSADATRITNHVNFSNPIIDPYKKVCADVNRSGIINTQDATLITQCLAGNPTALAVFNVFWRFTPTDYVMPVTAHQNVPPFPEFKDVPVAALDVLGIDFFGMKIGDVASPWADPQNAPNLAPLVWVLQDQTLVAGKEVELTFTASNFNNLAAYQFALDFDPTQLKFVGFQPLGALPMSLLDNFGSYNADLGELRNVWSVGTGTTLADGTPVFRARFKVLASGQKLSSVLKLDDSEIECKAFSEALVPTDVKLVFTESVGTDLPTDLGKLQLQLLQNRPNPFTDATTIGFILPESCEAHIRILDISGRELASYDRKYTAGYHELDFRMENAASYGMLFCELVTPQGKRTIKMMTAK